MVVCSKQRESIDGAVPYRVVTGDAVLSGREAAFRTSRCNGAHDFDSTERAEAAARGAPAFSAYIGKQFQTRCEQCDSVMARRKSEAE
jgi:hypothetical protein